jgi:hypothetical protein
VDRRIDRVEWRLEAATTGALSRGLVRGFFALLRPLGRFAVIVALMMARAIGPLVITVIVVARGPRAPAFGTALPVFTGTRRTAIGARAVRRTRPSPLARSARATGTVGT